MQTGNAQTGNAQTGNAEREAWAKRQRARDAIAGIQAAHARQEKAGTQRPTRQDVVQTDDGKTVIVGPTNVRQLRATRIRAFKEFAKRTNRAWPILDWDAACDAQMESLNEAFPIPWPNADAAYDALFLADEAAGNPDGVCNI